MRGRPRQRILALALGLLALLVLVELGLRGLALGFTLRQQRFDPERSQDDDELVVLCIGESTTAMGRENAWPNQLQGLLQERLPSRRVAVINRGVPGVDTSVLLGQLQAHLDRFQPDVVAVMMGANDLYTGAIPWDERPMAERPAQVFKTWKLIRQVSHQLRARGEPAPAGGPLDARRWNHVEGPLAAPQSEGGRAERRAVARARDVAKDGNLQQAALLLQEALREHPQSALLYEELGVVLRVEGRLEEADVALQRAAGLAPRAASVRLELAALADAWRGQPGAPMDRSHVRLVEQRLEEALALDPVRTAALSRLATVRQEQGDIPGAIEALERALAAGAQDGAAPLLVDLYRLQGRSTEALALLERTMDSSDACDRGWLTLADLYRDMGQGEAAEALLAQLEEECWERGDLLGRLAENLRVRGDGASAERVEARRDDLARRLYCPLTHRSYRRLGRLLAERGILLVAVQYPRRPLRGLLRYVEPGPGVAVVDNEAPFDEAVAREGYDAIFLDRCYGDFGHATPRGNRILAGRVADVMVPALGGAR